MRDTPERLLRDAKLAGATLAEIRRTLARSRQLLRLRDPEQAAIWLADWDRAAMEVYGESLLPLHR